MDYRVAVALGLENWKPFASNKAGWASNVNTGRCKGVIECL